MRRKAVILSLAIFAVIACILVIHINYRLPLRNVPEAFEGVYSSHFQNKLYYIQIINAAGSPEAIVYVKYKDDRLDEIGRYSINVYKIMPVLNGNHGWHATDEVLRIDFPKMDGTILNYWIGDSADTYLVNAKIEHCIEGFSRKGVFLATSNQTSSDTTSKRRFSAHKLFKGGEHLTNILQNQQVAPSNR